ncbi:MAG: hypothetical protein WCJ62_06170 [Flavobacterium sp.]
MKEKKTLCNKWKDFFNVVLDPWVLILLAATICFICYSNSPNTKDKNIISILTLIISLFSAIIGGILANRWSQMADEKVLVARGKSAIRSLKLILINISKIEKRTKHYISQIDKEKIDFLITISNFEEIIEKCNVLEEEIISSIENWTDIIPEVENLKTQVGVITEMKINEAQLENDVSNLKASLATEKELGESQNKEMLKKIFDSEKALVDMRLKLSAAENKLNSTVLSGLTSSSYINNVEGKLTYSGLDIFGSGILKLSNSPGTISGLGDLPKFNTSSYLTNQPKVNTESQIKK